MGPREGPSDVFAILALNSFFCKNGRHADNQVVLGGPHKGCVLEPCQKVRFWNLDLQCAEGSFPGAVVEQGFLRFCLASYVGAKILAELLGGVQAAQTCYRGHFR